MILTGNQITKEVEKGSIFIDPFHPAQVNPNSYNYRLGKKLRVAKTIAFDASNPNDWEDIIIPKSGYILQPGKLYLGSTVETIGSDTFVPSLIGRSSLGRLGLFLQITADLGHIGTKHKWTLELEVVQPLKVYPNMIIGQVSFWQTEGLELLHGSIYREQNHSYADFSDPHGSMPEKLGLK